MKEEIWKNTEYDGYMVSSKGRVKSKNKILSANNNGHGYLSVMMSNKNCPFRRYVHRLVAKAFVENPNNYPQINHKDGNKQNNNAENLEWCTQKQNNQHAWDNGLCKGFERTSEYRERVRKTVKRLWKQGVYKKRTSEDWTPEQREKARIAQINSPYKKRGKDHPCAQRVMCIETGEVFDCIKYADAKYGGSGVKGIFGKKQKTAYGMHWKKIK